MCSATRTFGIALLVGVLCSATVAGTPAARVCSEGEARIADAKLGKLRVLLNRGDLNAPWPALHVVYEKYGHCNDGVVAEGFSDAVQTLVAHRWPETVEFLTTCDEGFRQFVVSHVDATGDAVCLLQARKNAVESCPPAAEDLCAAIERACLRALEPLRPIGVE